MNFHDKATWENYDSDKQADLRVETLCKILPEGVRTILDVGSGNGLITNQLADEYCITGMDTSEVALRYLKCPSVLASITDIPFADNSFDVLICNEVLEHLGNQDLAIAVNELKRVARDFVIIGVPHSEQLNKLFLRCAICGHIEHPYGHVQSFSNSQLSNLLSPEYSLQKSTVYGPQDRDYLPLLLQFRQRYLKQWFAPYNGCKCSKCCSTKFDNQNSVITKAVNGINKLLVKPRPYWFLGLYKRAML